MRLPIMALLTGLSLSACQSAVKPEEPSQEWRPSAISDGTKGKFYAKTQVYEQCLSGEMQAHVNDKDDSRRITDLILRNCEDKLAEAKAVLTGEGVPEQSAEMFVKRRRSQAAQKILPEMMAIQAVRSANERPATP